MDKKEQFELLVKIVERADKEGLLMFDRASLIMDLEYVNDNVELRLEDLLNADKFEFTHDIIGIQNNFNRKVKKLENCFLPRFVK